MFANLSERTAIFLLFDGVQVIDFSGPFEVLHQAGLRLITTSLDGKPVKTCGNLTVIPDYDLNHCPKGEFLIIPGGDIAEHYQNQDIANWLQNNTAHAILSICNGAFFLAHAGLLDGLKATTFYAQIDELRLLASKTQVVNDQRIVDNGKIITCAGQSAGIDGALYLIGKLTGEVNAQQIALHMEYNWQPNLDFVRAAFADKYLRKIFGRNMILECPEETESHLVDTQGHHRDWQVRWKVTGRIDTSTLLRHVNDQLLFRGCWEAIGTEIPNSKSSLWNFTGEQGSIWQGFVTISADGMGHIITIKINNSH